MLCYYLNELLSSRVGVSCRYGFDRWCGTRYRRECNQYISRVKVGIANILLNGTEKGYTNNSISLIIDSKPKCWFATIQPPWSNILLSQLLTFITRKCNPLLFGLQYCFCNKIYIFYWYGVGVILAASSYSTIFTYTSPSMSYSTPSSTPNPLENIDSSINSNDSRILTIIRGSYQVVMVL